MSSPRPASRAPARRHRAVEQHVLNAEPVHRSRVVTSAEAATAANASAAPTTSSTATAAGRTSAGETAQRPGRLRRPRLELPPHERHAAEQARGERQDRHQRQDLAAGLLADRGEPLDRVHARVASMRLPSLLFQRSMHALDSPAPMSWLVTWSAANPRTRANSTAAPTSKRCWRA